jgi:hypothetical protein
LPSKLEKPSGLLLNDDRKQAEAAWTSSADEKFRALRQYHRVRGLCDRCVEKWSYSHKCAPTVQLHVIQEMWELMSEEESVDREDVSLQSDTDAAQLCLFVSEIAVTGKDSPKSMRLLGQIQGMEILMLVNSGSSNTFISAQLAAKMTGVSQLVQPLSVKVANGLSMQCQSQF